MRITPNRLVTLLMLALLLCAVASIPACKGPQNQPKGAQQSPVRPRSTTGGGGPVAPATPILTADPCANRLHDIAGAIFLYYVTNHRLPEQLTELSLLPGFEHVREFTCPESKRPYVYNPSGMYDIERRTRVILYDPAPTHAGHRWAVTVVEPGGNEALVAKVVLLSESRFLLQPAR